MFQPNTPHVTFLRGAKGGGGGCKRRGGCEKEGKGTQKGRIWKESRVQGGRGIREAGEVQSGRRRVQEVGEGCRKGEEIGGGVQGRKGRVQEGSIPFQSLAPGYQLRQGRQERSLRKNVGLQLYMDSFSKGV